MLIVGHAPQELVDIVGYNPVIELDCQSAVRQITDILCHIADYQPLVDRNRAVALGKGGWKKRVQGLMGQLGDWGYSVLIK